MVVINGYLVTYARAPLPFTVNTTLDSHDIIHGDGICLDSMSQCSLRAAIEESNVYNGSDTIEIPSGNYPLDLGQIQIADSVTINGAGMTATIIDGKNNGRIFLIDKPGGVQLINVAVNGVGMENGNIDGNGGGIWNDENLTLIDVGVYDNRAFRKGGGLYNTQGKVEISNSEISNNDVTDAYPTTSNDPGGGGGVYNFQGNMLLTNTVIQSNAVTGTQLLGNVGGAGIVVGNGNLTCYMCIIKNNKTRVFNDSAYGGILVWSGNITLNHSIVEGNGGDTDDWMGLVTGGGIFAFQGSVSIASSEFLSNTAQLGSAIIATGSPLNITNSLIKGNQQGVAVIIDGQEKKSEIIDSIITENGSSEPGGGIGNHSGNVTITRSTISNNSGSYFGGLLNANKMHIFNSTISGNVANTCGSLLGHDLLYISHTTISSNGLNGNTSICTDYYNALFKNSIIDTNCSEGYIDSNGYNLIKENNNCGIIPKTGDIVDVDPQLKPLGEYGSSMPTHSFAFTSPARNAGTCFDSYGNLVTTDQRGVPRFGQCDIGSYEYGMTRIELFSSPSHSSVSDTVFITATVIPIDEGSLTGSINFLQNGTDINTISLDSSNQATITLNALPFGINNIVASYLGDSVFMPSTSSTNILVGIFDFLPMILK